MNPRVSSALNLQVESISTMSTPYPGDQRLPSSGTLTSLSMMASASQSLALLALAPASPCSPLSSNVWTNPPMAPSPSASMDCNIEINHLRACLRDHVSWYLSAPTSSTPPSQRTSGMATKPSRSAMLQRLRRCMILCCRCQVILYLGMLMRQPLLFLSSILFRTLRGPKRSTRSVRRSVRCFQTGSGQAVCE